MDREAYPPTVKIRGVYSTALTKLLYDVGFKIVEPSLSQIERLNLKITNEKADIRIYDREDLMGVFTDGGSEALCSLRKTLHSYLYDAIVRLFPYSVGGIYKGKIEGIYPDGSLKVNIGNIYGRLRGFPHTFNNLYVMVQVLDKSYLPTTPYLTDSVKLTNEYAILVKNGSIKISRKIVDLKERERLLKIGKEAVTEGWGVVWRRAASGKPDEVLLEYVKRLCEEATALENKFREIDSPSLLREGFYRASIEFPYESKMKLDDFRSKVTWTIKNHHLYKSWGSKYAGIVDMAERLLEKEPGSNVESILNQIISKDYPIPGDAISIRHVKIDGRTFNLGLAEVESIDEDLSRLKLRRRIKGKGIYDGIETSRMPGDYSETETGFGKWMLVTSYFSNEGVYKGSYININTPVEVCPKGIRYVDLEVDICLKPDGELRVVDEELLEKAAENHLISYKLVKVAREKANTIYKNIEQALNEEEDALRAVSKLELI